MHVCAMCMAEEIEEKNLNDNFSDTNTRFCVRALFESLLLIFKVSFSVKCLNVPVQSEFRNKA